MKNKKILLTGGLGFIFSHVSEFLRDCGNQITVIDNCSDGSNPHLTQEWGDSIKVVKGNINDIQEFDFLGDDFDFVIHAAACSCVDASIDNAYPFLRSNVLGTHSMLEWSRKQKNLSRFLMINTDEVYGSSEDHCSTDTKLNPSNPYSASKASAGHLAWSYANTYGLPVAEVRMCNVIGRRQANTKLLPRLIENIKNDIPMPIYDDAEKITREYLDVRNVAHLIEMVLQDNNREIYNLTFCQELSIMDVVRAVENQLGRRANIYPSSRKGHDNHYRMIPHKITDKIGQYFIRIQDTIKWMLD